MKKQPPKTQLKLILGNLVIDFIASNHKLWETVQKDIGGHHRQDFTTHRVQNYTLSFVWWLNVKNKFTAFLK